MSEKIATLRIPTPWLVQQIAAHLDKEHETSETAGQRHETQGGQGIVQQNQRGPQADELFQWQTFSGLPIWNSDG